MEQRWALKFAEGSVQIGSLLYYRSIKDESGMIVDPHEGLEVAEVTAELAAGPMLAMMSNGNLPPVGSLLCNEDNRRLVSCASESACFVSAALSSRVRHLGAGTEAVPRSR